MVVVLCFGFCLLFLFPWFCKCKSVPISSSRVLDDRQCFTARSARHKKKNQDGIRHDATLSASGLRKIAPVPGQF